jgi:uncharacterized protein (TIGR03067 family)
LPEISSHSTTCVHGFNYRIDPTTTPPTIDFLAGETNPNGRITKGDQLFSGIYKLRGDRLTIACRSGEWRPEEFESTPGSRITLFVLKRSKPEAGPKPGSPLPQHSEAPSKGNEPEQPSPNPAAELKALQDQWKVVRVEKGKDADVAWAYINAFGSPLDPATTDRFDFIGNASSGLDEEEHDYLSIRKVDPRSRCITDHLQDLHFRYRINSASTIKTIDILRSFAHRDGPTTLDVAAVGIYEFRGDRLRICLRRYSSSLSEAIKRPTSFAVEHDPEGIFFEFERYRPSEDVKAMQGDWKVVMHIEDGRQVIAKDGQPTTYRFDDPAIVIPDGHPIPHGINNAIFALDAAKQPKQINLTTHYLTETYQEHEATLAGIYQLEGDRLTIAYHVGEPRPEKSESAPGSGVTLLVLERSKPQTSASDKPAEPEKTGPE